MRTKVKTSQFINKDINHNSKSLLIKSKTQISNNIKSLKNKLMPPPPPPPTKLDASKLERFILNYRSPKQIYEYILELGEKTDDFKLSDKLLVKGCETPIWLKYNFKYNKFLFSVYCKSPFIQRLANICIAIFNEKSKEEILKYDFVKCEGITKADGILSSRLREIF